MSKQNLTAVEKLAQETGKSTTVIYRLIKRLGRLPRKSEVLNRRCGRPPKYFKKGEK